MRAALAKELDGIDSVELSDVPEPVPGAGQVLVRVHGAGVGPWDVGFLGGGFPGGELPFVPGREVGGGAGPGGVVFLGGGFPGVELPFVPGQEISGVVEEAGDGAGVRVGDRVY